MTVKNRRENPADRAPVRGVLLSVGSNPVLDAPAGVRVWAPLNIGVTWHRDRTWTVTLVLVFFRLQFGWVDD